MIVSTTYPDMCLEWLRIALKCEIEGKARGALPFFLHGLMPELYDSGIVYLPEPNHGSGVEDFAHPRFTLERGHGDCDDLVIYRLAELWAQGTKAQCAVADLDGDGSIHVQIRMPDGTIEDPSIILGAENDWPVDYLYDL